MTTLRRAIVALTATFVLSAALTTSASAVTRWASPSASAGQPCTDSQPCTFKEAVENASATAFDIKLLPGTYGSVLIPLNNVGDAGRDDTTIAAADPAQRPVVHLTNTAGFNALAVFQAKISDIDFLIHGTGSTLYGIRSTTLDRVTAHGDASVGTCIANTAANSVCSNTRADGAAIVYTIAGSGPATLALDYTNVVAWSTGANGAGIEIVSNDWFDTDVVVRNSIIHGNGTDFRLSSNHSNGADLDVVTSNSNFEFSQLTGAGVSSSSPASNGNQTAPPLFTNAATGDFHQLPGSPTIDAGDSASVVGMTDAGGGPRIQGPRVDIGAFEAPAPVDPPVVTNTTISKRISSKSRSFTIAKGGSAFQAASKQPKKKRGKPTVGTLVTFTLSQADSVNFTLERAYNGRKSGSKCVKLTKANKSKKKCIFYRDMKGTETVSGVAGANKIWWTGRWKGKALSTSGAGYSLRGTPIKASTGSEPGVLSPRPSHPIKGLH